MRRVGIIVGYLLIVLGSTSCSTLSSLSNFSLRSKFRRVERNPDWHVKYDAGLNYFDKGLYFKASVLFDQILPVVRGLPEGEKVQFEQAYCQFYQKFYLLSSEQFKTFFETYGRSSVAEEARYMYAFSLFKSSPRSDLDQTSSIDAMSAMQEFINRFPNSKFKDKAVEVIIATQEKLEEKGFENAKQYYRMRMYKAAVVSLNNFKNNFPDSKYVEEAYYLVILSQYNLALLSIKSKQLERYKEIIENYKEFIDKYPASNYLVEAEKLYSDSLNKLSRYKNNNS